MCRPRANKRHLNPEIKEFVSLWYLIGNKEGL
jgi:hypothetical protein